MTTSVLQENFHLAQNMQSVEATSSAGLLALLNESDQTVQVHALKAISEIIDRCWAEVADHVSLIESLYEDPSFPERELAALVASKCYYHLQEHEDALRLALGAGTLFTIERSSEFVDRMIGQCIDQYGHLKQQERNNKTQQVDSRLEHLIDQVFKRCMNDGAYTQAIGIALDTFRVDVLREVFDHVCQGHADASDPAVGVLLRHCFDLANSTVTSRSFRQEVFRVLLNVYQHAENPDWVAMCRVYERLNAPDEVANALGTLVRNPDANAYLIALQIAFDIVDNDNQDFIHRVRSRVGEIFEGATEADVQTTRISDLKKVLGGAVTEQLYLHFLFRHSQADPVIMKRLKTDLTTKPNPILHQAAIVAHGYMFCGTTRDRFFRENSTWMGKASNWAKFSVTAHHGVVHKGHRENAMNLLSSYLPDENSVGVTNSPYVEGGALYALGLIHANRGTAAEAEPTGSSSSVIEYLSNCLKNTQDETLHHGACLGLGLVAMATGNDAVYAQLREILFQDSAVAGEAAGLAIGLVLLGKGPTWVSEMTGEAAIDELLNYVHDTQHEKTIRGIALGLAFVVYGMEEQAEPLIQQLLDDGDPILRYGCMYALGMAYIGSANTSAIRRLLHVAVSDVSDDVRRAAVTNLGFVMYRVPDRVPKLVKLLTESYNSHVRYGACMAMAIACAGTGSSEAIQLIKPLVEDDVDIVKQGAILALSFVCQQQSETRVPEVKSVRSILQKTVTDKLKTTMVKMGAVIGHGIIDAGGRNSVMSLGSKAGFTRMPAVVGMAVWLQHWYWFPLMHFLSLSLQPTALVGLNADLDMPNASFATCCSKPSSFAYPELLKEQTEEKKQKVATVELSTSAKARTRRKDKGIEGETSGNDNSASAAGASNDKTEKDVEMTSADKQDEATTPPEPQSFEVSNPSRVTLTQRKFITYADNSRWSPVYRTGLSVGVVVLQDKNPSEAADVQQIRVPRPGEDSDEGPEPDPPAPFEWTPTD